MEFDVQTEIRCDVDLLVKITPIGRDTRVVEGSGDSVYALATIEDIAMFISKLCSTDDLEPLEKALEKARTNPLL